MPYKIIYTKEATDFIQKQEFSLKINLDKLINKIIKQQNKDLETLVTVDLYKDPEEGWEKLSVMTKVKGKCFHEHLEDCDKLFKDNENDISFSSVISKAVVTYDDSYEDRFNYLFNKWKEDTRFISDYNKIINDPSYLEILGLGKDILPFIFKSFKDNTGFWLHALEHITNKKKYIKKKNPTRKDFRDFWLIWGVNEKYLHKKYLPIKE